MRAEIKRRHARRKISRLSVAAATAAKKPEKKSMLKDNTRPCSGTSSLRLLLSRPRPSENFVQESNIILGSHTFSEFHSMSGLYGTRYPSYVRRARQDFTLNRFEILVISSRTNVYNTQIRRLNFCRTFLLRYAFRKYLK